MLFLMQFQVIFSTIALVFRHWSLIKSLFSFPGLPKSWSDSEAVRLFVIALMTSDTVEELTKLADTKWDKKFRNVVTGLANQPALWDMAWEIIANADSIGIDTIVHPKRLRERIRERFSRNLPSSETERFPVVESVKDLATAIVAVKLIFDRKTD